MNKEPVNKDTKVLSDKELEGIVGGHVTLPAAVVNVIYSPSLTIEEPNLKYDRGND